MRTTNENNSKERAERIVVMMKKTMDLVFFTKLHKHKMEDNLTFNQFQVLCQISKVKTCSVKYISDQIHIAMSTTSELVERLVKAGYLIRESDLVDRRKVEISISQKGIDMITNKEQKILEAYEMFLSYLEEDEQELFEESYKTFYSLAVKVDEKYKEVK